MKKTETRFADGRELIYYDEPPPYIAGWHQAPVNRDHDRAYLHLEVLSVRRAPEKLKDLADSKSGMAVWINDATPERIDEMLRAVAP